METENIQRTVIVIGKKGTGKSSFINLFTGSTFLVSSDLENCTEDVSFSPVVEEYGIRFVDTPGFSSKDPQHIYDHLYHIALALSNPYGAHGFVVCLEANRLDEVSEELLSCLSKNFLDFYKRSILVFTKADSVWSSRSTTEWLEKQKKTQVGQFIKNFEDRVFLLIGNEVYEKIEWPHGDQVQNKIGLFEAIQQLPEQPIYNKIINDIRRVLKNEQVNEVAHLVQNLYRKDPWYKDTLKTLTAVGGSLLLIAVTLKYIKHFEGKVAMEFMKAIQENVKFTVQ